MVRMPKPPAKPDQKPYQPPDSLKVPVHVSTWWKKESIPFIGHPDSPWNPRIISAAARTPDTRTSSRVIGYECRGDLPGPVHATVTRWTHSDLARSARSQPPLCPPPQPPRPFRL